MNKTKKEYGLSWIFKKIKGTKLYLVIYAFLIIINTIVTLSLAYFIKLFVDIATGDINKSLLQVGFTAVSIIGIGGIITMVNSILNRYISGKTERNLRMEIMDIILSRRMLDISKQHTGELLTKLTIDVESISNCFPTIIKNMVGGIVSALVATVALFVLNWKMAIIMFVTTPLLMIIMNIFNPFMQKASETDKKNDEINRTMMQEDLGRIILIKTYFMQNKIISKIKKMYSQKLKSGIKVGIWEGLILFFGELMGSIIFLVALGVGAYFVLTGETTTGTLIAIVQLLNYIINPISNFGNTLSQINQALVSSNRISEFYNIPSAKIKSNIESVNVNNLVVDNLNFSYDKNIDILKNVNAIFNKNVITGIIGKSGIGKSTFLKLITGLYEPDIGKIELKHSKGIFTGEEILTQIAYVPSSDYLFSGTIAENIAMVEKHDLNKMKNAAQKANILDFIENLQYQFNTQISESGSNISNGQAQRIAIARAIYKEAPIIVLDEPTANLDIESIENFQNTLKSLCNEKIIILVTHDNSIVNICEKVYIIDDGTMKEKYDSNGVTWSSDNEIYCCPAG